MTAVNNHTATPARRPGTTTVADLLAAIAAAPEGPTVAAVVDLDDALLSTDPLGPWLAPDEGVTATVTASLSAAVRSVLGRGQRPPGPGERVDAVLEAWTGRDAEEVAAEASSTFRSGTAAAIRTEVWRLLRAHRSRGHTVVLASPAPRAVIDPVAAELGADEVVGTDIEVSGGLVTGRRPGPVCTGRARADAVAELAAERGIDLARSFAYVPARGDRELLGLVGHPVAVSPTAPAASGTRSAPVLTAPDRGTPMGPTEWASTAGFYAGFFASTAAGAGIGALRRSRYEVWNATSVIAADVALGLAGIDVDAHGIEHMWSHRPAVFIFNHMGLIDAIVAMKLLQGGFTGVAKAETRNWPVFGQLFQIAEVAFVDRAGGSAESVRAAMEPAVDKLRSGISLALAPEGTRSPTPTPGPFKKGAFHMAMQAGVPVVPIVLHNSGEVMWRKDVAMRPGTIRVDVLPPIDTSSWTEENLGTHVEAVRAQFLETLDGIPVGSEGVR